MSHHHWHGGATLDYLSLGLGSARRGSVWTNLYAPGYTPNQRERQANLATIIRRILTGHTELERYVAYLCAALRLDTDEVEALLWEHPRPLLTQVLPTALRRLETQWRAHGREGEDYQVFNSPLPEFAPANLFSELNLPEVEIRLPQPGGRTPDSVVMPIVQAMREFAPGRVSRRYGLSHAFERHWICPTLDQNREQVVPLDPYVVVHRIGDWQIATATGALRLPVYRPRTYSVQQADNRIVDSSNARLRWRSQIVSREEGLVFAAPAGNPWATFVADVRFQTHQGMAPVEARRMALGSDAAIRFQNGTSQTKTFSFTISGRPAAIGFGIAVDAFCIRLRFPENLWSNLGDVYDPRYRAIRTARFHDQAVRGPYLDTVDNVFAREWLAHLILAAISNEAIAKSIDLRDAADNLANDAADLSLDQTLDILFQSPVVDDANGQGNIQDRLRQDLGALLADTQVRSSLFSLASILWTPITSDWEPWLRERFAVTVAAAAFHAILCLCPEIDGDGLVVDIDPGPREPDDVLAVEPASEVWISEVAPGGNGQIEETLRRYAEDPRRFFSLMTASLRDNDFALSDFQLCRFLEVVLEVDPDGSIAAATQEFRDAYGADASHRRFAVLRQALAEGGFVTFHAFMVALANRVLRPGSSRESDVFFLDAMRRWDAEETRLGVELDARVLAYRLSRRDDIDEALSFAGIDAPTINPDQWRFGVIYGLLWPRGAQIRQSGLRLSSIFIDLPIPEPLLVRPYISEGAARIDVCTADWQVLCLSRLAAIGTVTLTCLMADADRLADAFAFLATNPVQTDYLSVFARAQAIRRVADCLEVDVDVAEALQ